MGVVLERGPFPLEGTGKDIWERKYDFWHFEVRDGAFHHDAGRARAFELAPKKAFSYGRGGM